LRDQVSSVSLDEEAAHLIQLQRAYQAAGKMMSVLNELTGTVIDIIK
jgi:flagellar hook-associated protein 1